MKRFIIQLALVIVVITAFLLVLPLFENPLGAEQSKYSGNEDHKISIEEATGLTRAYRISAPSDAVLGHYFGKKALVEALAQPGCVGARIYYGKHKDGSPALVVVGVDSRGNDMTAGVTLQRTMPCPPACPDGSILKQENSIATLN
jgi:hypothetical protein